MTEGRRRERRTVRSRLAEDDGRRGIRRVRFPPQVVEAKTPVKRCVRKAKARRHVRKEENLVNSAASLHLPSSPSTKPYILSPSSPPCCSSCKGLLVSLRRPVLPLNDNARPIRHLDRLLSRKLNSLRLCCLRLNSLLLYPPHLPLLRIPPTLPRDAQVVSSRLRVRPPDEVDFTRRTDLEEIVPDDGEVGGESMRREEGSGEEEGLHRTADHDIVAGS